MKAFFYIFEGFADWECAYALAELRTGRYFKAGATAARVVTVSDGGGSARSMGGLYVQADMDLRDMEAGAGDILMLPGGEGWEGERNAAVLNLASRIIEKRQGGDAGPCLAAICGATLGLAKAGLLNEIKHTSNAKEYLASAGSAYRGHDRYVDAPAVADGGFVTASGLAALEFAYEIFSMLGVMESGTAAAWLRLQRERSYAAYGAFMASLGKSQ